MRTAFRDIELDLIRYSVVWEDYTNLEKALELNENDHLAMITSAGCNVLNACLSPVKRIEAIDINPVQNLLLELKIYLILNHSYSCFEDLLGFNGEEKIKKRIKAIKRSIPEKFVQLLPPIEKYGLLGCGKLERYIHGFLPAHPHYIEAIKRLLSSKTHKKRIDFITKWPQLEAFKRDFCAYFDSSKLSQGRDPKLFQYSEHDTGLTFFKRLIAFLNYRKGELPFIFHFFFFGPSGIPPHLRPACYSVSNFSALKKQVHKIEIITLEAFDYFRSGAHSAINKYALSNIFEYCSAEEYQDQLSWLLSVSKEGNRFIHWNLLNHQEYAPFLLNFKSRLLSREEACFYFHNLKIYQR
ncbi:MAG TPA: hypothetical protein DIW47_12250 [Bacteroidetes bacterium]|nr:hypothetical protein [Bacteroidota bacterium]